MREPDLCISLTGEKAFLGLGWIGEALLLPPRNNPSPCFQKRVNSILKRNVDLNWGGIASWAESEDWSLATLIRPSWLTLHWGLGLLERIFKLILEICDFRKFLFVNLLLDSGPFSGEAEVFVEHKLCSSN